MQTKRKCSIYASLPITCFSVPIIGHTELNLTADEIYKCLCAKAEVIEILPNGKTQYLDFSNYNKTEEIKVVKECPIIELIKEEPVIEEKPVVEESTEVLEEVIEEESVEETIEEEVASVDEESEDEEVIEEAKKEESPVRTHELSSRNNNYNNNKHQNYNKNKKNKNKR